MKNENGYTINLQWDQEENVWTATSDEIIGLVLEADSIEQVIKKCLAAVPELVELNNLERRNDVYFLYNQHEKVMYA